MGGAAPADEATVRGERAEGGARGGQVAHLEIVTGHTEGVRPLGAGHRDQRSQLKQGGAIRTGSRSGNSLELLPIGGRLVHDLL